MFTSSATRNGDSYDQNEVIHQISFPMTIIFNIILNGRGCTNKNRMHYSYRQRSRSATTHLESSTNNLLVGLSDDCILFH